MKGRSYKKKGNPAYQPKKPIVAIKLNTVEMIFALNSIPTDDMRSWLAAYERNLKDIMSKDTLDQKVRAFKLYCERK